MFGHPCACCVTAILPQEGSRVPVRMWRGVRCVRAVHSVWGCYLVSRHGVSRLTIRDYNRATYTGVWVDMDTVFLRDIRPMLRVLGEVGGRFAMTQKNNNAFLALQKGSVVASALLDLVCKFPRNTNYGEYCSVVGMPCHTDWW